VSSETTSQNIVRLRNTDEERALLGRQDATLRLLRRYLGVRVFARKGLVTIQGPTDAVEEATLIVERLRERIRGGQQLTEGDIERVLRRSRDEKEDRPDADVETDGRILRARDDTPIQPKTEAQARYVRAVEACDIVFAIGPAGTGKTYLAVAMAIRLMKRGLFRKLVLVRPAVEAGEHLGFLPGDLTQKVSPYLRPLYDALGDFLEFGEVRRYEEHDVIEVVPLAYMRGRTLDNAFIILDEGQNTSPAQMKMFLTRMGRRSKIVVTGDITQTDLPKGKRSGLLDVRERLRGIDGIAFCTLGREDIVRHSLVQRIVDAYEATYEATDEATDETTDESASRPTADDATDAEEPA
jgi:phosphate starvation-inducible PhoH-like protein